jgi:Protein of unknown function (DUF1592)/Protein of unknown function (DUF1588)/Protein of unknown function (DUF1585)/Protein of unknown function (DUF1587)/Protein of unknown function (DUF1595)
MLVRVLYVGWIVAFCLSGDTFDSVVKPFLEANCILCHAGDGASGGLDLKRILSLDATTALASRGQWELISQKLLSGEMPPAGSPHPPVDGVVAVRAWIEREYSDADRTAKPSPGRVTARRLNKYEYNHTILDLLGLDFHPADDFPADDSGYGFDSIGDVLTVSPVLMEKYLKVAKTIADTVTTSEQTAIKPTIDRFLAERIGQFPRLREEFTYKFAADGEYRFRTTWFQNLGQGLPIEGKFYIDGKPAADIKLTTSTEMDRAFVAQIPVPFGPHRITASLEVLDPNYKKALPYLEYTEIQGPVEQHKVGSSDIYRRLFTCSPAPGISESSCARQIVAPLVKRAWRRSVTTPELNSLLQMVNTARKRGDSFEQAIGVALQAILVSPYFLYRIEPDPVNARAYHLNQYQLATRLAYFLWSSMPDDELLDMADRAKLQSPAAIQAQIKRMLASPKSQRLVEAFGGQWLGTRNLEDSAKPDAKKFPEYTEDLRDAMKTETQMFLQAIVDEDRSVLDLLDARFTYVNERLARFYGIAGVTGSQFRRIELNDGQRGGILTQASVLTVSSYPTRTSPVIRGKYILDNILGAPPPPPPPGVPLLDETSLGSSATVREQLERHRSNALCASCHSKMDPLGFGFENYDAIGRWRTSDGKLPIDATGVLPNGKAFSTPAELKQILKSDPETFTRCLVQKLLIFALGRGLESYDRAAVEQITKNVGSGGYRFSKLVEEIVNSAPFQMRTAAEDVETAHSAEKQVAAKH